MSNCSHVRARLCAIDNTVFAKIFRFVFIHDILRKRRVQFIKFEADRFRVVRSKCFWSETSSRFAPLLSWHDQEQLHEFQAFPSGRLLLIVAVFSPFNYTTKARDLFFRSGAIVSVLTFLLTKCWRYLFVRLLFSVTLPFSLPGLVNGRKHCLTSDQCCV